MAREITRRDLLLGLGATATSAFVPGVSFATEMLRSEGSAGAYYPPGLTGMRGSHDGSFEVAHQLAREGRRDWGAAASADEGIYDLVVVGGGVSGLSAAHFFRKDNPGARILILDNHDDFGGHAKRNEFSAGGRTLLTHGGSEILEGPEDYSDIAKGMFADLGIKPKRLGAGFDKGFYKRNELTGGMYFDKETFGVDRTLAYPLVEQYHYWGWIPVDGSKISHEEAIRQIPVSEAARAELLHLVTTRENVLPEMSADEEDAFLNSISYKDFLSDYVGLKEPEIFLIFENLATDWCVGIEAVPAIEGFYWGLPGIGATSRGADPELLHEWFNEGAEEPPTYHFPDGNASVARRLVHSLIPGVADADSFEEMVTAGFDYSMLDRADSDVRLRLRSTAIRVEHDGNLKSADRVGVTYVQDGNAKTVQAKQCVLACYNQIIPHLCPELPQEQREALATMVKSPIFYTNVALRNWEAWKNIGVGSLLNPGSYFTVAHLEYPVDFGEYRYPRDPAEPAVVHMVRFPHKSNAGLTPSEQKRAGRYEIFSTSFETLERSIRRQLAGSLSAGDFDPERDIEGITVNRWAHAYINRANPLYDEIYDNPLDMRYPFVRGRQPFGRVAIANADSGSSSLLNVAIDQAHRAICDLS